MNAWRDLARRAIVAGVAGAALVVGCSGEVAYTPAPFAIPETAFAEAYAEAYCAFGKCCSIGAWAPNANCRAEVAAAIQLEVDGAHAAGSEYDALAAAECVHALRASAESCPTWKSHGDWPDACLRLYRDKPTPPGEPCASAWECADEGAAVGSCWGDGVTSRCELYLRVGEGEPCGWVGLPFVDCAAPLRCHDEVCVPLGEGGGTCPTGPEWGDTCVDGWVCDRQESKMCVPAKKPGEACDAQEECEMLACDYGRCEWYDHNVFPRACAKP